MFEIFLAGFHSTSTLSRGGDVDGVLRRGPAAHPEALGLG